MKTCFRLRFIPAVSGCHTGRTPCASPGSQRPFRVGQISNPYPHHYSTAFASSGLFYLQRVRRVLRIAYSRDLCLARPARALQAYHVPQVAPISGVRTPLYTGGHYTCVGPPLKPPEPVPRPLLGLEPLSRLSSALLTMRNTEVSLSLSLPAILHNRSDVRLVSLASATCLRPHRCP